jgi:sodium transport system permease protein
MNLKPISVVYLKEMRDLLRDRRTVISMIVVPMIVLPGLLVGISLMANKVVKTVQFVPAAADYTNRISGKSIGAALEIPPGFDAALESGAASPAVRIYTFESELKSTLAAEGLEEFFRQWKDQIVSRRLEGRHIPKTVLTPFSIVRTNVVSSQKITGNLVGMILPYMVILMCMTGAIYPAIDLTAGEKERGTLETLLCSPVARTHLALGKVLIVLTVSVVTALLSISSNGVALVLVKQLAGGIARGKSASLALDPASLAGVALMMIPMAVFVSALMVALGLFARSSKEAGSYLQPLIILAILPAAAGGLPGVEMNYGLAFIPVFNVSVISKEILAGVFHWNYIVLVFSVMGAYAFLAVVAAVAIFKRESVLFRT